MNKTGVHYTPEYIANFVVDKISSFVDESNVKILEPCVGEGVFIKALHSSSWSIVDGSIDAVEIDPDVCKITRSKFTSDQLSRIRNTDFLNYNTSKKYDLIIGNPPYVNIRYMTSQQVKYCDELSTSFGEKISKSFSLKNLWTAFIVKSSSLLSENGVIAFVLPSDFAHVNHASPIKEYLTKYFSRVELYEFKGIIFDDAEQNAMLMIAVKNNKKVKDGLFHSTVTVKDTKVVDSGIKKLNQFLPNKWTNYGLNNSQFGLLKELYETLYPVREYCDSCAGIVTAANAYFILSEDDLVQHKLESYAVPILQKAAYVNGSVTFDRRHWSSLKNSNVPCYLLDFSDDKRLSNEAIEYISKGESRGIDERYKCAHRDTWYKVPNIGVSEGFFFKRCHLYPKLIMNKAEVCVTDTAYSITMKQGYNMESLIYSFYNSLSLVYAEILGRKYAGGVLELTPSEFKNIPLPYTDIESGQFNEFKEEFSNKETITDVVGANDGEMLMHGLGLSKSEVNNIQSIYKLITKNRLGAL